MARLLEFDYEEALERGTQLFWKSGYAETSVRDLLRGMQIGEGSFYNTLKSKKHAYLECLKHYNATVGRRRAEAFLCAPTAALGVRALFCEVLNCIDDPKTPSPICMMAGTMAPEVLAEPEVRSYVEGQLAEVRERMAARLRADMESGLLADGVDPEVLMEVILTYIQGLWRMAAVAYDRARFEGQIDLFLTGLSL